jgi:hypothetical protein
VCTLRLQPVRTCMQQRCAHLPCPHAWPVCRTIRRPLFDATTGEWSEQGPEATPALNRLLCKPLKHLWQDCPDSRARDGNARWSPTVSEYRQAALQFPLQHAAEAMLTAELPEGADGLQAATAALTTTGRCVCSVCGMQRPGDALRLNPAGVEHLPAGWALMPARQSRCSGPPLLPGSRGASRWWC